MALGILLADPMLVPSIARPPMTERAVVPLEQRHGYEMAWEDLLDLLSPPHPWPERVGMVVCPSGAG